MTNSFTVSVAGAAPVVTASADVTINEGGTFNIDPVATFTDAGFSASSEFLYEIDFGDGSSIAQAFSGPHPLAGGGDPVDPGFVFTLGSAGTPTSGVVPRRTHVYQSEGTYTVTVRVTDEDLLVGSDTLLVTVENAVPTLTIDSVPTPVTNSLFRVGVPPIPVPGVMGVRVG